MVVRNFKTKMCEIDIVSVSDNKIYFTEVKYRKNDKCGGGLAAITAAKLKQMKFAVEVFLKYHPEYKNLNPMLAVADVAGEDFEVKEWFVLI